MDKATDLFMGLRCIIFFCFRASLWQFTSRNRLLKRSFPILPCAVLEQDIKDLIAGEHFAGADLDKLVNGQSGMRNAERVGTIETLFLIET